MEAMLRQQADAINLLERSIINFSKDPKTRKTPDYFRKKITELEGWRECFVKMDSKLKPYEQYDQPYFIDKMFEQAMEAQSKHMKVLKTSLDRFESTSSADMNLRGEINVIDERIAESTIHNENILNISNPIILDESNPFHSHEMNVLNIRESELKSIIEIIHQEGELISIGYAKIQHELLKAAWNDYRDLSIKIQASSSDHEIKNRYQVQQRRYAEAMGSIDDIIHNGSGKCNVELPKIKLPEYDGKNTEWRTFIELFDKIVHCNRNINNAIKMQYLKTCLKGDAAKLVNHIAPTAENYESCYEIIQRRYDNKRELLGKLFDSILLLGKHKSENSGDLRSLHDTATETMMAIKNAGIDTTSWDPLINHILLGKLHRDTIRHYECQLFNIKETETFQEFLKYIESRCLAIQSAEMKSFGGDQKFNSNSSSKSNLNVKEKTINCVNCNESHYLSKCQKFLKLEPKNRSDLVRNKKLCVNCFGSHKVDDCKSKYTCRACNKKHHSLLHFIREIKANVAKTENTSETKNENNNNLVTSTSCVASNSISALLATALITVESKLGQKVLLKALIDQGSQSSFISENALQTLNLKRNKINAHITGIGEKTSSSKYSVDLRIFPRFKSPYVLETKALVLDKLTKISSVVNSNIDSVDQFNNLLLADPSFGDQSDIDIILGVVELTAIIKPGLVKSSPDMPIAQDTEFGWIISGPIVERKFNSLHVSSFISNVELDTKVRKFFEQSDIIDVSDPNCTDEDIECEQHFLKTVRRNNDGRYVVMMPLKNGLQKPDIGESRKMAIATQMQLERRFLKNPKLKVEYEKFIDEYINLGHMEAVPYDSQFDNNAHYLPHHCVFKESTTTKLRVVFNASQKTTNGLSLNESLAMGASHQRDLLSLFLQFRTYKYAFSADIEKMYRQILIDDAQTDWQRIIWRASEKMPFTAFRLKTITYGTANAPYMAIRVLKQLSFDMANRYPIASRVIRNDMYMDDVLSGAFSIDDLIQTYDELKNAFKSAGFNLRKWCCNSSELLNIIPECDREMKAYDHNVKALGVSWSPTNDEFTYELNFNLDSNPNTKRLLLSEIASLFDPLGWICPVIIRAKNFLQELWRLNVDWDEIAPTHIVNGWLKIKSEYHLLNAWKMPRWINYMPEHNMELHGFCDASQVGIGAVIYIKNSNLNAVELLVAKARVVPKKDEKNEKSVTIPRLELSAALLLANLTSHVLKSVNINFKFIRLWSDSRVALSWINANPKRYKTFVSNKISKIQALTDKRDWMHVSTENNPADCASRGLLPSQLVEHSLWWHGPAFLTDKSFECSTSNNFHDDNDHHELMSLNFIVDRTNSILPNVSSFYRLKRIMGFCLRFIYNCKYKNKRTGPITAMELEPAEIAIVKIVQHEALDDEFRTLKRAKQVHRSSRFIKLSPYIDNDLIRVGGRLKNANLPFESQHQILLPRTHFVCKLIIIHCHLKCMHGGLKLTESTLREKYWITNARQEIKNSIDKCLTCFRQKSATMNQIMGDLPKPRVMTNLKPFTNIAIDYTGAIAYKLSRTRGCKNSKAYIAIFVCMATKAIHVELVSDLTADAFVASLRRMIARRGSVLNIYSDNGTCFVRANKDLIELNQNEAFNLIIYDELAQKNIQWHFSPAGAPHFNGLAEAGVKTVKSFLKKSIHNTALTFEELSTLLNQIEACVNSRPITPLSSDPDDMEALTPGHFLIGQALTAPADDNFDESNVNWLSKWQLVQKIHQNFWKRFREEYLQELQQKSKWLELKNQPNVNELVLVKEENVAPCNWPMGRILKIHTGDDGIGRVVTLKMKNNVFQRPITKIAPLPIEYDDNDIKTIRSHILKTKTPKSYGANIVSVITALLALSVGMGKTMPIEVDSSPYNISRFDTSPGLYFEKQASGFVASATWNVASFIQFEYLHEAFDSLKANVDQLKEVCFDKNPSIKVNDECEPIVIQLQNRIERMKAKNDLIFGDNHREKRSLFDGIGKLQHALFGVLDSDFAEKYEDDMSTLLSNQGHLAMLLKNHTSVIDSALNTAMKHDLELKYLNERVNNVTDYIANHLQYASFKFECASQFSMAGMYVNQFATDYEYQQDAILEILTDAHKNHVNHYLFPPGQIRREIERVSNFVKNKFLVPEGYDLYKILEITPYMMKKQIVFKISFPLFRLERFNIYKIIRVPSIHGNELWWINNPYEYLISATDHKLFQFMTELDVSKCSKYRSNTVVCKRPQQWLTSQMSNFCAWNLFIQSERNDCSMNHGKLENIFIELNQNKWIFIVPNITRVTAVCNHAAFHNELQGEGILELNQNCLLSVKNIQLNAHKIYEDLSNEIFVPKFNHSELIKFHSEQLKISKHEFIQSNFTELRQILAGTRNFAIQKFNRHDVHHYFLIYIFVIVFVAFAVFVLIKYRAIKLRLPMPAPRRIPMPTISGRENVAMQNESQHIYALPT